MLCPHCKTEVDKKDNSWPFCSERCKKIDLGSWAKEKYRIAGKKLEDISTTEDSDDNTTDD